MSDFMQKKVVLKTIDVALEHGYKPSYLFDGEQLVNLENWVSLRETVAEAAIGTDECQLTFAYSLDTTKRFVVFFAFDNPSDEMIYDHTDSVIAEIVCLDVATFFEGA